MNKHVLTAIGVLAACFCGIVAFAQPQSFIPENGFIPDEKTAISVGVAVLEPIYGKDVVGGEQPFSAVLSGGIWTVKGTFPKGQRFGGVAELRISKKNGCIISVTHGQ
jgi:hypothetical protein